MKNIILFIFFAFSIIVFSQTTDKTVTLVVSGQGKTQDEATQNGLRSAIEQSCGAFVTSKTEILNDSLVRDEIVSVSSGNIEKYEVISQVEIPTYGYSVSLKATVSIQKLSNYIENKGYSVELNGSLFSNNVLIQEFYRKNELMVIENLVETLKLISNSVFDYTISASEPKNINNSWNIPIIINARFNGNFNSFQNLLLSTLKGICLNLNDISNLNRIGVNYYPITLASSSGVETFKLRNSESILEILTGIYSIGVSLSKLKISNGAEDFLLSKYNNKTIFNQGCKCYVNNLSITDEEFRPVLYTIGKGPFSCPVAPSLFYYYGGSLNYEEGVISFDVLRVLKSHIESLNKGLNSFPLSSLPYGYNKESENRCGMFDDDPKFNDPFESFKPLKKLIMNESNLGVIVSLANIKPNVSRIKFSFNDIRTIEEISRIKEYKVITESKN